MNREEIKRQVQDELAELESRDIDQLYGCLQDSLSEMGVELTQEVCDMLYAEIEFEVEAELRADQHLKLVK